MLGATAGSSSSGSLVVSFALLDEPDSGTRQFRIERPLIPEPAKSYRQERKLDTPTD